MALRRLAWSLVPSLPAGMVEAVNLLTSFTLVPPDGHERVLEAITYSGQLKKYPRFLPIVKALMANIDNDVLTLACLRLINSIANRPDDLNTRLHLRNEFMRAGLADILEKLARKKNIDLQFQLEIFEEHHNKDLNFLSTGKSSMPSVSTPVLGMNDAAAPPLPLPISGKNTGRDRLLLLFRLLNICRILIRTFKAFFIVFLFSFI